MDTSLANEFEFLIKENTGCKLETVILNIIDSDLINIMTLFNSHNIQKLNGSKNKHFETIKLFAQGNYYTTYRTNKSLYLALSSKNLNKLKLISLIDLANESKTMNYSNVMSKLDCSKMDLDRLLLEAFTSGILSGKIDHKNEIIKVLSIKARDYCDMANAKNKIATWLANIEKAEAFLDEQINSIQNSTKKLNDAVNNKVECICGKIDRKNQINQMNNISLGLGQGQGQGQMNKKNNKVV